MKDLLFKLLSELKPYQTLTVHCVYGEYQICNSNANLPLALNLDIIEDYRVYPVNDQEYENEYARQQEYMNTHSVEMDGRSYIIRNELIGVEYKEDYFMVHIDGMYGESKNYLSYDCISRITIENRHCYLSERYNKLQWQLTQI